MQIIVLIKQVPEMDRVRFDAERGVIDRKSAGVEINPFDLNALELAVEIKETVGGQITALSMGPARAEKALREALARGADRALLLSDSKFAGADTWATSLTLARALNKMEDFDLIIAGEMSVDGDTAQVGPQTAEHLDIPHVSRVISLDRVQPDRLEITAPAWGGEYQRVMLLPGLLTVSRDINFPRLPTLRNKMAAREAEIIRWDCSHLAPEITPGEVGSKGSPTRVKKIVVPAPVERQGRLFSGEQLEEGLEAAAEICREKGAGGGQL